MIENLDRNHIHLQENNRNSKKIMYLLSQNNQKNKLYIPKMIIIKIKKIIITNYMKKSKF